MLARRSRARASLERAAFLEQTNQKPTQSGGGLATGGEALQLLSWS